MWMLVLGSMAIAADPCVFDTDAYKASFKTTDASVLSAHHVVTTADARGARTHIWTAVLRSGESLTVQGGGCDHLGLTATLYIPAALEPPALTETALWIARAQKLPDLVVGLKSAANTLATAELTVADNRISAMLPVEPGWGEFIVESPSQGGVLLTLSAVMN